MNNVWTFNYDPHSCPCYQCTERCVGCHGTCEKYKQSNDDILDFDNDGDGYIDGVWIIYLNPCVNEKSINWYRQHDRNFIYDEYILK